MDDLEAPPLEPGPEPQGPRLPEAPWPPGFHPIETKTPKLAPDALLLNHRYRPLRSQVPVKHLRFEGDGALDLARNIEAKAWLEGKYATRLGGRPPSINDVMLRLLRRGLQAESSDKAH